MSSPVHFIHVDTPRVEHVNSGHVLHHSNSALYPANSALHPVNSGSLAYEPTILVATPLPLHETPPRSLASIDHIATFREAEAELRKVKINLSSARRNRAYWALFFQILNWAMRVALAVIAFIAAFLPYVYKTVPTVAVTCLHVATFVASLPMFASLGERSMERYQNAKELDQIHELCSTVQMLLINVMKDSIISDDEAYDLDAAIAKLVMASEKLSLMGMLIDITGGGKLDAAKQSVSSLQLVIQTTSHSSTRTANVFKRQNVQYPMARV